MKRCYTLNAAASFIAITIVFAAIEDVNRGLTPPKRSLI
jgi:hypothetical protein